MNVNVINVDGQLGISTTNTLVREVFQCKTSLICKCHGSTEPRSRVFLNLKLSACRRKLSRKFQLYCRSKEINKRTNKHTDILLL